MMKSVASPAVAFLILASALSAQPESVGKAEVSVLDKEGRTVAQAASQGPGDAAVLRLGRAYREGDRIRVAGDRLMMVSLGNGMPAAVVCCPRRTFEFAIPFGKEALAYGAFAGEQHTVTARRLMPTDLAQYRNLALNPADTPAASGLFPHATTNSVCREEPVFAARNAIDGVVEPKGHGKWPHQSWGPDMKEGLSWRLDFGRDVEVDRLCVVLRADVPHDKFFEGAALAFSDGTTRKIEFKRSGDRQSFSFPAKTVSWLELRDFALPKDKGWCAVTEIEAWGRESSPYVKKETWRETVVTQWGIGPSYVLARAMQDFPAEREQLEITADWVDQDHLDGPAGLRQEALRKAVAESGEKGSGLPADLDRLAPSDPRRAEIYLQACALRREARLAPYAGQVKQVVFTKHYDLGGSHYAYTEGQSDAQAERHFQPGAALCLLEMDGPRATVRTLLEDPNGVIRDPDVSYDGKRILFAWKKSLNEDDYHLYEMTVADGKVRQLTSGLGYADYEGAYLPNGDIVFNSTRCVQTVDCWWTEVSNIFTCDGDGRYLRRLSYDQVHTNYPTVTPDGRVIYTRWDYSDRGQIFPQGLFQMNPDGTGQTEVYGNNSWFPTTILHARAIPGSQKIVAIFTGHHTRQKGWLGIIEPDRGREENSGAQLIAPVRATEAVHIDVYGQWGDQFQYPYPLSETEFLVAYKPVAAPRFGIYFMTADGGRERLAADPKISCNQPVPLAPRPAPHLRPNRVDYRKDTAVMYLHDIYLGPGLRGIPRGAIKSLRVVAIEYRAAGIGRNGNSGPAGGAMASTPVSIQGAWDVKRILGSATVYPDGSACFVVPPRTPIYLQALDAKGYAVQTMRSWATLQPGETFSCVGCHEEKSSAPPVTAVTQALKAGPQELALWHIGPRGFSFIRDVQPILDQHCVRCHYLDSAPQPVARKSEFDPKTMRIVAPCEGATWRYTTDPPGPTWNQAAFDDSGWKSGPGGFGVKGTPGARVGTPWTTKEIWLRRAFELPGNPRPATPALLVHHDEDVEVYLNGVLAGQADGYTTDYELLPMAREGAAALQPGRNVLAVHCRQTAGGQFIDVAVVDTQEGPPPAVAQRPPDKNASFSLKGVQTLEPVSLRKWSDAYVALANRKYADWINIQSEPSLLPPYHAGAAKSRLIPLLEQGHYDVKLSQKEMDILAAWMDLLVPYCGDYTEAMAEEHIPKYNHFLEKRMRWKKEEARNIEDLVRQ